MTHDDTHAQIARARKAAVLSKVGSLAGALAVVALALGVVGLLTDRTIFGVVAIVIAVVLVVLAVVGMRMNSRVRQDPAVQQRTSRLRRARYLSAYPPQEHADAEDRATRS